ncbi:MAG TPA: polysaccharide pyruvyl transferase family protein, partial [Chroococcidiopsis sp.]
LARAAEIFNSHPNLTLFTRDQFSYDLARQHFDRCRVLLAPDMVFHLAGRPDLALHLPAPTTMLYHCRTDRELNRDCLPTDLLEGLPTLERPKLVVQDWASYRWVLGTRHRGLKRMLAYGVREGWQRGLTTPQEWRSRQTWLSTYPHSDVFSALHRPEIHRQSWSFLHSGLYQFQSHRLIMTNRLHGHILATLLGIPHIFLPNSYHKNQAFYRAWTKDLPGCRFVADPAQMPLAIAALLNDPDGVAHDGVSSMNTPVNAPVNAPQ